ncbi:MAG TPA: TIGR03435 family protein [Bryobacteraceae bacterium]|nr:TIGR03435 family protein [Bryobacteraceae bacterium]
MKPPPLRLILTWLLPFAALAQPAAPAPAPVFDVASVKPSTATGDLLYINLGTAVHGEVTLTNVTLSECIQYAYGLSSEDQISGPDWIRDRRLRVDIVAKAPPNTPPDRLLLMTQALLAERFHLVLHRERKPLKHLALAIAKNGPKLPAAAGDGPSSRIYYGRGRLNYTHLPMSRFALLLSRQLKQVVVDNTGLAGSYDVNLEWTPDDPVPAPSRSPDAAPLPETAADTAPGIFKAIERQLGLTLEASKAPVDVLVVDSAEKVPVGN